MTYPFGSPGFSGNTYNGSAEFEAPPIFGRNRVVLVAIHGGLFPPILHERNPMQRMRIILLPPDQTGEFDSSDILSGAFRRALPPMPPALPMPREDRLQPRPVRGEILRDQEGRLYEKIGGQIRPLHKLVSGPNGEILDLTPSGERGPEARGPVIGRPSEDFEEAEDGTKPPESNQEQNQDFSQTRSVTDPEISDLKPAPYRKLFPNPGQRRVVRLGDFKAMLMPQLAHPERLRDTHRLACYLQIYEAAAAQRLESLAASVLGDPGRVSQLQPLTELSAQQLGLMALLRSRPRVPANFSRKAGLLLPYEKVFRLELAHDPTADDAMLHGRQPTVDSRERERFTPAANANAASTPNPSGLKNAIPERFLKPWEFKSTREEVLYDMNVTATFAGWLSSLGRWLKGWIRGRGEFKKWQALLLSARSQEEQLWAVRPPKGGVSHRAIRDWTHKTLELAGYDARTMLLEWEIFWRRKGL